MLRGPRVVPSECGLLGLEDQEVQDDAARAGEDDQEADQEAEPANNGEDEFSLEDYMSDDDIPSYKLSSGNYTGDEERKEIPFSAGFTFHEFLDSQLGLRKLNEQQQKEVVDQILIYNKEDLEATWAVLKWLKSK